MRVPDATHATIATFDIDLSREAEAREALHRFIVPSVRQAPGFVSGHWTLDRDKHESVVLVTFEFVEQAASFVESVRANRENQEQAGVHLTSIRVVEVTACASGNQHSAEGSTETAPVEW